MELGVIERILGCCPDINIGIQSTKTEHFIVGFLFTTIAAAGFENPD